MLCYHILTKTPRKLDKIYKVTVSRDSTKGLHRRENPERKESREEP